MNMSDIQAYHIMNNLLEEETERGADETGGVSVVFSLAIFFILLLQTLAIGAILYLYYIFGFDNWFSASLLIKI